jgi:ferredoxin-NADP reductase
MFLLHIINLFLTELHYTHQYRYRSILLAAGGIGVTPIIGMLKDIYDVNVPAGDDCLPMPRFGSEEDHVIETIYFLWAMPSIADYETFRNEVEEFILRAKAAGKPNLVPLIYITRSKENLISPLFAGRPNIVDIYQRMMKGLPPRQSALVFVCGPQPLVAECWDRSIRYTMKGSQVDFHHEIFEF